MFEKRRQRKAEALAASALSAWEAETAKLKELLETARTFRGWGAAETAAVSTVSLKGSERCYGVFSGALLIEPRVAGGHWEGRSQGVSIPVVAGVRYRIGASKGHYVKGPEEPTVIDTGTAAVTDHRVFFFGPKNTREWLWSKCLSIEHHSEAPWTVISVSNRQKASGLGYDEANTTELRFRIDLAHAVANGIEAEFVAALDRDYQQLLGRRPVAPSATGY